MRLGEGLVHEEVYRRLTREYSQASCVSLGVILSAGAGAIVGGWIATVAPGLADPGAVIVITMGMFALVAYGYTLARRRPRLSPEEIRQFLPLLNLDEGEQAYVQALLALGENPYLDEDTAVQILQEMNRLLDTYYQLADDLEQLREAMGTASEQERDALRQRLAGATDPEARAALEESLHLLEQRLQNRLKLDIYVQRMEAHIQLVLQTLKSLRDTLARLRVVPERVGELDVEHLRLRLLEIQQEAAAIENAVQEILSVSIA